MIKYFLLSISAVAILGGCATTSKEVSDNRVAIVMKAMAQVVSDTADQMDDVSAAEAMDCKMANAAVSMLVESKPGSSAKMGALVAAQIWDEVYNRRTDPDKATLADILAKGPLMTALDNDDMSSDAKSHLMISTVKSCTATMQAAMSAAKALREAKS